MTTPATKIRHILIPTEVLPNVTETAPICGELGGGFDVPSIFCSVCLDALEEGTPRVRLFPSPATADWHIRVNGSTGKLYCGAEGFTSTKSVSDQIPFCPPCVKGWMEERNGEKRE